MTTVADRGMAASRRSEAKADVLLGSLPDDTTRPLAAWWLDVRFDLYEIGY
jgi:hypothetical protein